MRWTSRRLTRCLLEDVKMIPFLPSSSIDAWRCESQPTFPLSGFASLSLNLFLPLVPLFTIFQIPPIFCLFDLHDSIHFSATSQILWRIMDHEQSVRDQTRKVMPNEKIVEPQVHAEVGLATVFDDLIFRDSAPIDSSAVALRHINWPETRELVHQALTKATDLSNSDKNLPRSAKAVVSSEVALCDTRRGYPLDNPVYNQLHVKSPNWRGMLANLYWRALRQATFWDVYLLLLHNNFLHEKYLTVLKEFLGPTPETGIVTFLLGCFSSIRSESERTFQGRIPLQLSEWITDIEWCV